MITIIGPYPTIDNECDGMVRRVKAIDDIIGDKERTYLTISFFKNIIPRKIQNNNITVYYLNFFIHLFFIYFVCIKSKLLYVHSIYNSLFINFVYLFHPQIITDMHGVVVEEIKMNKKHSKFLINCAVIIYSIIEYIAIRFSYKYISVTRKMESYFYEKYNLDLADSIVLPIFDTINYNDNKKKQSNVVIYAGGTQPWQCIKQMLRLLDNTHNMFKWIILTSDIKYFEKYLKDKPYKNNVRLDCVSPKEVESFYCKSTFGIVLREDNIVNRVACPTKLIEYLQCGVIPIVKTPYIGDFYDLGYKYIVEDNMKDVNQFNLVDMINTNKLVIKKLELFTDEATKILRNIFSSL